MSEKIFKNQVSLLLSVLPIIAKHNQFALFGGTAINLFLQNMPRLSVDIDLIYTEIQERGESLRIINELLKKIQIEIEGTLPNTKARHDPGKCKLFISNVTAQIKVEVNMVKRGLLGEAEVLGLCNKAQDEFDTYCEVPVMPTGQLLGSKLCAALARQHPRDLFDVKYILEKEGVNEDIKTGFLLALLSSDRPIHEVLFPTLQDHRQTMVKQFDGMTGETFTYDDFESTREQLIKEIHQSLTDTDKIFLIGCTNLSPNWSIYNFEYFPSVQWKLLNLQKLKDFNPEKFSEQLEALSKNLSEL